VVADIAVNNRSVYICNPPSSSECLSITMSCGMGPAPMPDVCSHYVPDNPTASSVLLPSSPSIGSGIANVPRNEVSTCSLPPKPNSRLTLANMNSLKTSSPSSPNCSGTLFRSKTAGAVLEEGRRPRRVGGQRTHYE
jgi:hypothetical protein